MEFLMDGTGEGQRSVTLQSDKKDRLEMRIKLNGPAGHYCI